MHLSVYCPTYMKSILSLPWSEYYDQMPPFIGLYTFTPLFVNIDQIPLIWGTFIEIKSPPFAGRGVPHPLQVKVVP